MIKSLRTIQFIIFAAALVISAGCKSPDGKSAGEPKKVDELGDFFTKEPQSQEVFRVLLSSDRYEVKQLKYNGTIEKGEDKGGDSYIMEELKKLDMIDESRESIISVWLYPDSGRVMKIRPQRATFLLEVDKLIQDDIQRWNFVFPKKMVSPTKFEIRYKVVLKKKQSDDQIMKEIREKMKDNQ